MQEYEEQLYAGAEKDAYREARMAWLDKLLEIDNMDKEIMLAAAAAERESKANEPGGEDE